MHTPIIIAGPTASGKSDYAENLARQHNGEIVNADAVQMYTKLSVGTAKPDWRNSDIPHHLFDICDQPVDFDVVQYRKMIAQVVADIQSRGKLPILVGGSLFYIKSLFYPPVNDQPMPNGRHDDPSLSNQELWDKLEAIDAARADQLHPNDRYRVARALHIYNQTGVKPSELKPKFDPLFAAKLRYLAPPLETLYARINARTLVMINDMGWVDEAVACSNDAAWRDFVAMKGFIGYPELFEWITAGKSADELPAVIEKIQQLTRNYAKRQRTFWRSFAEQLAADAGDACIVATLEPPY